jgi:hypothetical protein
VLPTPFPDVSTFGKEKTLKSDDFKVFSSLFRAFGGDKRDRTADLLNAIQALSQLSYTPKFLRISQVQGYYIRLFSKMQALFSFFRKNFGMLRYQSLMRP